VLASGLPELQRPLPAAILLALTVLACLPLMGLLLRRLPGRASGASFLLTVAPEGLAVAAAALAPPLGAGWLWSRSCSRATGLALYPLVLGRFELRDLISARGEHWAAGGSLAFTQIVLEGFAQTCRWSWYQRRDPGIRRPWRGLWLDL
jgi:hypothetical protein